MDCRLRGRGHCSTEFRASGQEGREARGKRRGGGGEGDDALGAGLYSEENENERGEAEMCSGVRFHEREHNSAHFALYVTTSQHMERGHKAQGCHACCLLWRERVKSTCSRERCQGMAAWARWATSRRDKEEEGWHVTGPGRGEEMPDRARGKEEEGGWRAVGPRRVVPRRRRMGAGEK